jgi:DNA-binding HxlR family transcriptional regulator
MDLEMPLRSTYRDQECSVAAALEVIGERWTLLVVRSVMLGSHRFEELRAALGIATNVLQTRLSRLVEEGILERRPYQEHPERYEYRLTEKGLALWPVLAALMDWGDSYLSDAPPLTFRHRDCGGAVDGHRICASCGERLEVDDVIAEAGPGASPDHRLRRTGPRPLSPGPTAPAAPSPPPGR